METELEPTMKCEHTMELTAKNEAISVNTVVIPEDKILSEMQYHPGSSQRDSMIKACEALIISEVLKQRANEIEIETDDDSFVDKVLQEELHTQTATDDECRRYYDNNLSKFTSSPIMEVSHILLAASPEDALGRIEAEDKAKAILEILKSDDSEFVNLASNYSQCPSAKTSGQLGQISRGQTVKEFENIIFAHGEGLIEKPIESRYGYHVVKINRRIDGKQLDYPHVSKKIFAYLNEQSRRKAIVHYLNSLIDKAEISGFNFGATESQAH